MSSWLEALNFTAGFALRNLLSQEPNPNKVLNVKSENYSNRIIKCREDGIVLYGPTENNYYEIVLHRPCTETLHQVFSIFRTDNVEDAEARFRTVKDKLPVLAEASREMVNIQTIQKICDALREHPSWTVAHLAAYFGMIDCFQNSLILSHLNSSDIVTGISPLQVAIRTCNLRLVQALVNAKASLEHVDYEGNSVFHEAASTTKDIILTLSAESTTRLNSRNANGHAPLHRACLSDKPECVKALLRAGADVNIAATHANEKSPSATSSTTPPGYMGDFLDENSKKLNSKDMKFGGTPLHWCCSREVIDALLDMGCDIDALNFDGRTALHLMVFRKRLECVVCLLSRGAEVNIGDKDGNTPLHIAVQHAPISFVKALVVFGADLAYRNKDAATPRHLVPTDSRGDQVLYILHSVGAPRCDLDMTGCSRSCSAGETEFKGTPPPEPRSAMSREILDQMVTVSGKITAKSKNSKSCSTRGGRILCLDGGGIRGLVLVQMLLELEKEVKQPIIHCFDWIAGTSTGGILALGLAAGKTLKECLCLYMRMKDLAFVGGRPYNSEPLENMLKECLGASNVMTSVKHPKLIITAVMADRKPVDLHLFRNYESPMNLLKVPVNTAFQPVPSPDEQLMWRAARATGAAPSYFRAYGRFLDGGLIANNPTLDVLTEIHEYNLALDAVGRTSEVHPPTVVVSLGTGLIPLTELKEIDVFRPDSILDTAKLAYGISTIGNLLVDQATASDGRIVDRARAWCSMIGISYFRFSPQMSEEIAMDEKSDEKLVNMMWEAKAYMHANYTNVKELAVLLNNV